MATNIYSWNVNGIRAVWNKGLFQQFIEDHDPDILCLQETKAQPEQSPVELPQYKKYWYSAVKKGYSGTAIFSKTEPIDVINGLPVDLIEDYKVVGDIYGDANLEGRVMAAEFDSYYVVTCYTPNAKDNLERIPLRQTWDAAMTAYCARLQTKKPVIYCGDMNVAHTELDLTNPKPNVGKKGFTAEERSGFDNWLAAGFVDTFRMFTQGNGHYTWWSHFANARSRNVGWRIDYFLVSEPLREKIQKAEIHADVMGSDHCPVSVTIND